MLESSPNHYLTPFHGEMVFYKTWLWCLKGWGPLLHIVPVLKVIWLLRGGAKSH